MLQGTASKFPEFLKFDMGLKGKSLMMLAFSFFLGVGAFLIIVYWGSFNFAMKRQINLVGEQMNQQGAEIEYMFKQTVANFLTIKEALPLNDIGGVTIDSKHNMMDSTWQAHFETMVVSMMNHHPDYLQVRYIDSSGNELVRVNSKDGRINIAGSASLQDKANRYYFTETMALKEGEFLFSSIDLNREHGEVVQPYESVFRIATPIYSEENRIQGMLIMNVTDKAIFRIIEKYQSTVDMAFDSIVDQDGNYIYSFDGEKEFVLDTSPGDIEGEQWIGSEVNKKEFSIRYDGDQHRIEAFQKIYFDPTDQSRYWIYVNYVPEKIAFSNIHYTFNLMLVVSIIVSIVMVILIMSVITKRIINPVIVLAEAAKVLGQGNLTVRVDDAMVKDEMRTLYQTINEFAEEQQLSTRRFEGELLNRTTALRKSESRLNKAQKIAHVGNWSWDIASGELEWSDEIYNILGLEKGTVEPSYALLLQCIYSSDLEKVNHAIQLALADVTSYNIEHRIIRPDGEERYVMELGEIVRDDDGRPMHMHGIIHDITERKEVEIMQNVFVSTVSHELRTPLTSIRGTLGLMLGGVVGDVTEKMYDMLEIADKNSQRLLLLINDILDVEKISSGKLDYDFKPHKIMQLVYQSIEANKGYGDKYRVQFVVGKTLDDAEANVDESRFVQVMSNLLSNAAKFSNEGDEIDVNVEYHNGMIRISVRDYGSGIPVDYQPKVFERFTQAGDVNSRQKGGTGLGLNITKAIIEAHGGTIDFISTVGEGTTFYFDIPECSVDSVNALEK